MFETSGGGLSASILSLLVRERFESHIRAVESARAVIDHVNRELVRDIAAPVYVRAFVGYLDMAESTLTWSNAGHIAPLLYRHGSGSVETLAAQGSIVGIFSACRLGRRRSRWSRRTLLLFTDGMVKLAGGERDACRWMGNTVRGETPAQVVVRVKGWCERRLENAAPIDNVSFVAIGMLSQCRGMSPRYCSGFPPTRRSAFRA